MCEDTLDASSCARRGGVLVGRTMAGLSPQEVLELFPHESLWYVDNSKDQFLSELGFPAFSIV